MRRRSFIGGLWAATFLTLTFVSPLTGPSRAAAAEAPEEVRRKFDVFVASWMEKLRERERHNVKKIAWHPGGSGVEGIYVGYDTTNYQILPVSNLETTPIGKLVYMELKLRRAGSTQDEALSREPQIIERVQVTEIFRYHRGEWVY
jgi:hypothetical protein